MDISAEARIFEIGDFHLDAAKRQLTGPDGVVELPSRAFDVLLYMAAHPGELLDRDRLLKAVWPNTVVEEGRLSQCIFALRRAFGDTATEPRFIATVPGRGYQFVAQVRVSSPVVATPEISRPRTRWPLYAGVGLTLAVALLVAFRFWPASTPAKPSDIAHAPVPSSIAVLPFADLSPGKDMEYFADGIAEELMSSLSKVRGLDVIGRRSSFAFKGKADDAQSIGEKLRVATILEGSVRKEGDRIRITAQLTRTRDGVSLWAETYDRKFDDVLDIQGSIAREVVAALAPLMQLYQEASSPSHSTRFSRATRRPTAHTCAACICSRAGSTGTRSRREPSSCVPWSGSAVRQGIRHAGSNVPVIGAARDRRRRAKQVTGLSCTGQGDETRPHDRRLVVGQVDVRRRGRRPYRGTGE